MTAYFSLHLAYISPTSRLYLAQVAKSLDLAEGYRLVVNNGKAGSP